MRIRMRFEPPFTRAQVTTTLTGLVGTEIGATEDVSFDTESRNDVMGATIVTDDDLVTVVQVSNLADLAAVAAFLNALPVAASDRLVGASITDPQNGIA